MNAIILSIGDELVLGQTVDTNSAWLSQQLAAVGCDILSHRTVGDNQKAIEIAIRGAAGKCDFLLISGGIGPTEDDLTRQALAAVLRERLELNEKWLHRMEAFFRKLGRPMPETNKIQAMIPSGATMIENEVGTAAGIDTIVEPPQRKPVASDEYREQMFGKDDLVSSRKALDGMAEMMLYRIQNSKPTRTFAVPGVPKEMKAMFTSYILPIISAEAAGAIILSRTLHTFGLGESSIAEKLGDLMNRTRNPSVGTTVANGLVSLRINSRFPTKEEAQKQLEQTTQACKEVLGDLIFGQDDQTLPQIVAALLTSNQQPATSNSSTVSTAESCTGGLLAKLLTDIPGSSAYFTQGWITYSNQAKYERLGVSMEIINLNGAVSETVVEAMAKSARRLSKSTYALSISGIAGPTGGSPTKPVGTVCIALAFPPLPPNSPTAEGSGEGRRTDNPSISQVQARTFLFPGDREAIRDRAAKMALTMLRYHLLQKPMPL
jgi:nicotinamide-nucleotide amidase